MLNIGYDLKTIFQSPLNNLSMLAKNLKILRSNVQKFETILDNNVVIFAHVDWSGLLHKLMQNLACRLVHGADFGNGAQC